MSALRALNRAVAALTKGVSLTLAALITLFVFASIVSRNFFSYSFEYSVDANQLMFMWMCFMGIVAVYSMDRMLKFEMLEQHVPAGLRRYWSSVLHLLTMLVALVMMVAGWQMLEFAEAQRFSTMPVSYFWMYLPVPLAGLFLFFAALEKMVNAFGKENTAC